MGAPWTQCSKSCGGGRRSRDRAVDIESQHGGIQCRGDTQIWEWCRTNPCAADYLGKLAPPAEDTDGGGSVVDKATNIIGDITGQSEEEKKKGNKSLIII